MQTHSLKKKKKTAACILSYEAIHFTWNLFEMKLFKTLSDFEKIGK